MEVYIGQNLKRICVFNFSDKNWREWYDCVQTSYQRKSMGLGSSKCTAGIQKRETRLYHCHTEATYVSTCFDLSSRPTLFNKMSQYSRDAVSRSSRL